jgi:hypothetical protein
MAMCWMAARLRAPEVETTYARARALCQQVARPRPFSVLWGLWVFYFNWAGCAAQELADSVSP